MSAYPLLTTAERVVDGIVHAVGIAGAITAVVLFFSFGGGVMTAGTLAATIVYSTALILMLAASWAYHTAAYTRLRPWLRRLDHAAIYLMIAGTFTPFAVLVDTDFSYIVLGAVWAIAILGAGSKVSAARGQMPTGALPFVALGWVGAALIVPLWTIVPGAALLLMAAGGLTYTVGVIFYRWEGLRYSTAIWHGFVVAASACFFAAIATSVAATAP